MENNFMCRVCGKTNLKFIKASKIIGELKNSDFAITSLDYGITMDVYRCSDCHLLQCPNATNVLRFYENLEDPQYEEGRKQRYMQAEQLIKKTLKILKRNDGAGLRLLDVGAGSGVLLEAAKKYGFDPVGVEPCTSLVNLAKEQGFTIQEGVLSNSTFKEKFDVIMLIDVLEHVTDPLSLLQSIQHYLKPEGLAFVVTPDVSSFFARVLGFKWWHYRIAHISYFNKKTLRLIAKRAGLKIINYSRPGWYFSYAYLRERLLQYVPSWLLPSAEGRLKNVVIPINLQDSLLIVCEKSAFGEIPNN